MMMATLLVMFLIKHSSGTQDIHTVNKISVQQHQTIIIPCLYDQKYVSNVKYMSSGGVWFFSSSVVRHDRMSVVDNKTEKFFTATLRNTKVSDTGTYWCGISIAGYDCGKKLYLEVIKGEPRLHVSSQYVSGYEGGNAVVVCHGASEWCQIGGSCVQRTSNKTVVHISGDALNVTLRELKREDSGWYYCSDGKSQMPVHITVRKAPYTRRVTVQYTGHTTESSQDK
ncbi:hypothetical protein ABG768_017646 [Culter alburnus]|uniref:Immunoglobulin domain-containing protein n=1 Tax=Culter alburnus TaxID=194366 RepID=A0AAW1Z0A4_CULAL